MIVLIAAAGAAVLFLMNKKPGEAVNEWGLEDIDPELQGGNYKRDFDTAFEIASHKSGVPFALLKAHALIESSLNPNAYRNENPTNRADRIGWASRGLMQLLWWPNSERFKKYGWSDEAIDYGDGLFDPETNADIAAQLIRENLKTCDGNLRDAINMYNTGKKEAQYSAPFEYVNRVLKFYNTLLGK